MYNFIWPGNFIESGLDIILEIIEVRMFDVLQLTLRRKVYGIFLSSDLVFIVKIS